MNKLLPAVIVPVLATSAYLYRASTPEAQPTRIAAVDVYNAFDTSDSTRDYLLGPAAVGTARLAAGLDPHRDHLMLYRMDNQVQRFFGPDVPESTIALQSALVTDLKAKASSSKTCPTKFWVLMVEQVAKTSNPVVIILWTDGDQDFHDPQSKAKMATAIRRLAANPQVVAVCLLGVSPKNFSRLDREFAAFGLDRLRIYRPGSMTVDWVSRKIEEARSRASAAKHSATPAAND